MRNFVEAGKADDVKVDQVSKLTAAMRRCVWSISALAKRAPDRNNLLPDSAPGGGNRVLWQSSKARAGRYNPLLTVSAAGNRL